MSISLNYSNKDFPGLKKLNVLNIINGLIAIQQRYGIPFITNSLKLLVESFETSVKWFTEKIEEFLGLKLCQLVPKDPCDASLNGCLLSEARKT